ncbi:MAG TPA: hypothetical protein VKV18_10895 [Chthonomonas sp.]|uniref:hypothetical protein n=1 Tax=Chthonomonas sp. TaxID=2282153 RepID=UPI002B4AD127|nr:hypothetical protein [Chthonomonas sp.]HLI49181.1 hypothetical protein [Chthonomonas sp.]
MKSFSVAALAVSVLLLTATSVALAKPVSLHKNGDFETGKFTGWNIAIQPNPNATCHQNNFYISTPEANTSVNAFATAATPTEASSTPSSTTPSPAPTCSTLE